MPVFSEDPSQFSKERLKSELIAHNVALPPSDSKKQEYLELYLKNVDTQNAADFSSDEEEERPPEVDSQGQEQGQEAEEADMRDLSGLTDEELKARLLQHGFQPGPITATTRYVYEKKLGRLLEPKGPSQQNGSGDQDLYSDSEEEAVAQQEEEEEEQPDPSLETVTFTEKDLADSKIERKRSFSSKSPVDSVYSCSSDPRPKSQSQSRMLDKFTMTSCSPPMSSFQHKMAPQVPVTDVLMEIFPETEKTPTGIFATRRRPIKGAAGRPVQFKYLDTPLSPNSVDLQEVQRRQVPLWVQLVIFVIVTMLLYVIYATMEDLLESPLTLLLDGLSQASQVIEGELEELAAPGNDVVPSVADSAAPEVALPME